MFSLKSFQTLNMCVRIKKTKQKCFRSILMYIDQHKMYTGIGNKNASFEKMFKIDRNIH